MTLEGLEHLGQVLLDVLESLVVQRVYLERDTLVLDVVEWEARAYFVDGFKRLNAFLFQEFLGVALDAH